MFVLSACGHSETTKVEDPVPSPEDFDRGHYGLDVSHHNGNKWGSDMPAYINFVYVKATEGKTFKDPLYKQNLEEAKIACTAFPPNYHKYIGAYHFFKQEVPAKLQFQNIKETVDPKEITLPLAVDFEFVHYRSKEELNQVQNTLYELLVLIEKYYGKKPIIYCNPRGYSLFIGNHDKLKHYNIWLDAKLNPKCNIPNVVIKQIRIEDFNNHLIDLNICPNLKVI